MSPHPHTRHTLHARQNGAVETRNRHGECIAVSTPRWLLDAEDAAAAPPAPPSLVEAAKDVSRAGYGCETQTHREYVAEAAAALDEARNVGVTTPRLAQAIRNIKASVERAEVLHREAAARPERICCSACGLRTTSPVTREAADLLANVGWVGFSDGSIRCPQCAPQKPANDTTPARPVIRKVCVSSGSRPNHPGHLVTLVNGKAAACGCEAGRRDVRCWHLAAAEAL